MEKTKKRRSSGDVVRRIFTFLFAMFLGAALLAASVVGSVFAAAKWVTIDRLQGYGVSVPDSFLTEESPVREMGLIDIITELSAIPGRLSAVTLNALIDEYGVVMTDDVRAMIPPALMDTPLADFASENAIATILSKVTFKDAFVYTGDILTAAAREKLADRTLDLLLTQDFGKLFDGIYVGDLTGMPVELRNDGLVHPVLAEGERAYISHYFATVNLGEFLAAEDSNKILNDTLNRVPLSDMLSDDGTNDSFFYAALEDKMLGEILSVEGSGFVFSLDPILNELYLGDVLG